MCPTPPDNVDKVRKAFDRSMYSVLGQRILLYCKSMRPANPLWPVQSFLGLYWENDQRGPRPPAAMSQEMEAKRHSLQAASPSSTSLPAALGWAVFCACPSRKLFKATLRKDSYLRCSFQQMNSQEEKEENMYVSRCTVTFSPDSSFKKHKGTLYGMPLSRQNIHYFEWYCSH